MDLMRAVSRYIGVGKASIGAGGVSGDITGAQINLVDGSFDINPDINSIGKCYRPQ